jgi:hypothetical protein
LICENNEVEELILGLENIDPHYKLLVCEYWYNWVDNNHYVEQIEEII